VVEGAGDAAEAEFAKDRWVAGELGINARRARDVVTFTGIKQPWLREAVKEWSRFRLGAGYAFGTIEGAGKNMTRFSTFLSTRPDVVDHTGITRELLEKFLLWMLAGSWSTGTRSNTVCFVKVFLEWGRRHRRACQGVCVSRWSLVSGW